jgi:hypothetical protein
MSHVTIDINSNLASKLNQFIQSFGSKELMFEKFIEFHRNRLKREIAAMRIDLKAYEQKHGMNSNEFFEKFENGDLNDDSTDFILWSGIYQMYEQSKSKLDKLA